MNTRNDDDYYDEDEFMEERHSRFMPTEEQIEKFLFEKHNKPE